MRSKVVTQKFITLNCRRDFPENRIWPKLGFVAIGEKPSRSKDNHRLTTWELTLTQEEQLEIFQARTSDDTVDIIIDAHIFFDFDEPDSDKTTPSKMLLSDFLVDSLSLWITDELLNEIDRQDDPQLRNLSRNRAQNFPQIKPPIHLVEGISELLHGILPRGTPNQNSDIRHLAKAAASNVKTFVTNDSELLKKSEDIANRTGLEVIDPVSLIIRLHELYEKKAYAQDRIAGLNLYWCRCTSEDLASFPFDSFLEHQETKGKFREKLKSLIARPNLYECELLRSKNEIIAIRVLTNGSDKILSTPLVRVALSADRLLFGRFLITDTVSKAVDKNLDMVKFESSALAPSLIPTLLEMGFIKYNGSFVRFCISRCKSREEVLSAIDELCSEVKSNCQGMSNLELERCCSPLCLTPASQRDRHFLIPIRPDYAISLIDRRGSGHDLFGGNPDVLLLWENVYYRSATHRKMLKAPARILWYVSRDKQQIVAVSRLDEVVIETPKELLRKLKKFGILEWQDLYDMCDRDPSKECMALKFSHTFQFRKPVSLAQMRDVFKKNNKAGPSTQAPSKLSPKIFRKLFQRGFSDPS